VVANVCGYRALQGGYAGERSAANSTIGNLGKQTFDRVEPGRTRRREMHLITRMRLEAKLLQRHVCALRSYP
jgi:hypothetical protein